MDTPKPNQSKQVTMRVKCKTGWNKFKMWAFLLVIDNNNSKDIQTIGWIYNVAYVKKRTLEGDPKNNAESTSIWKYLISQN